MIALYKENDECVRLLIEVGADVDIVNGDGNTALAIVSKINHNIIEYTECVEMLVAAMHYEELFKVNYDDELISKYITRRRETIIAVLECSVSKEGILRLLPIECIEYMIKHNL